MTLADKLTAVHTTNVLKTLAVNAEKRGRQLIKIKLNSTTILLRRFGELTLTGSCQRRAEVDEFLCFTK